MVSEHFSATSVQHLSRAALRVIEVGSSQSVITSKFVELELRLRSISGSPVLISGEFHVVPSLACNILIFNDILYPYSTSIHLGKQVSRWGLEEIEVSIRVLKPESTTQVNNLIRSKRRRILVYAASASTVKSRIGVNLSVHLKRADKLSSYLFISVLMFDIERGVLATSPKALVSGQVCSIPFANLGEAPVRVAKRRILGHLSEF